MSVLHIECSPEEKAAWVRAAQKSPVGPGLADFVRFVLNRQAESPPIMIPSIPVAEIPAAMKMLSPQEPPNLHELCWYICESLSWESTTEAEHVSKSKEAILRWLASDGKQYAKPLTQP